MVIKILLYKPLYGLWYRKTSRNRIEHLDLIGPSKRIYLLMTYSKSGQYFGQQPVVLNVRFVVKMCQVLGNQASMTDDQLSELCMISVHI